MPNIERLDSRRFTPEQLLLTTEEAAEILRISRTTIYSLMKVGELRPIHIGRACRISLAEIRRYVTSKDALLDFPSPPPGDSQSN
jgi:excisionase family DNA binding protein